MDINTTLSCLSVMYKYKYIIGKLKEYLIYSKILYWKVIDQKDTNIKNIDGVFQIKKNYFLVCGTTENKNCSIKFIPITKKEFMENFIDNNYSKLLLDYHQKIEDSNNEYLVTERKVILSSRDKDFITGFFGLVMPATFGLLASIGIISPITAFVCIIVIGLAFLIVMYFLEDDDGVIRSKSIKFEIDIEELFKIKDQKELVEYMRYKTINVKYNQKITSINLQDYVEYVPSLWEIINKIEYP